MDRMVSPVGWHIFLTILSLLGQLSYFILGVFTAFYILSRLGLQSARTQAEEILAHAGRQAEALRKDAELQSKVEMLARREAFERELEGQRAEIREEDRRIAHRGEAIDVVLKQLRGMEVDLETERRRAKSEADRIEAERLGIEQLEKRQRAKLEEIAKLSEDEARRLVLERTERELGQELGQLTIRHEVRLKEERKARAVEILATAIQRHAAGHVSETTTSWVDLPSDELKGRIIGREGRNIRAFEKAAGVDLLVDETPGAVVISSFDPYRREIARRALARLMSDGRIHPTRIEETIAAVREEMRQILLETGLKAADEARVGPLHEVLIEQLGRLQFRTSYSQNVLRHSVEVAFLTGMMAEELGLDGRIARRCGLLHDIGKAIDQDAEGSHTASGASLAKRCGEPPEVVHAIGGHHDDLRADRPYTVLTAAADAVSASRPGARGEALDRHARRLQELEAIASGFAGVEHAYAIQAGREIRVIVDSRALDDARTALLCRSVAKAIQEHGGFPGEVKVTAIRETRIVEIARKVDKIAMDAYADLNGAAPSIPAALKESGCP